MEAGDLAGSGRVPVGRRLSLWRGRGATPSVDGRGFRSKGSSDGATRPSTGELDMGAVLEGSSGVPCSPVGRGCLRRPPPPEWSGEGVLPYGARLGDESYSPVVCVACRRGPRGPQGRKPSRHLGRPGLRDESPLARCPSLDQPVAKTLRQGPGMQALTTRQLARAAEPVPAFGQGPAAQVAGGESSSAMGSRVSKATLAGGRGGRPPSRRHARRAQHVTSRFLNVQVPRKTEMSPSFSKKWPTLYGVFVVHGPLPYKNCPPQQFLATCTAFCIFTPQMGSVGLCRSDPGRTVRV